MLFINKYELTALTIGICKPKRFENLKSSDVLIVQNYQQRHMITHKKVGKFP